MKEMTSKAWQRLGSSIIWSPDLLGPLVLGDEAVPLRVARQNIKPLVRAFQSHWGNIGLVFAMDGPDKLFHFNEANSHRQRLASSLSRCR